MQFNFIFIVVLRVAETYLKGNMADCAIVRSNGKIKYPASFYNYSSKLNLAKINKPILQLWITNEITSLLGFEDEIVTNTAINLFGLSNTDDNASNTDDRNFSSQQLNEMIDPKQAHVVLSGFLNDEVAFQFCIKLWENMIDASQQPTGIPRQIIEAKKRQLEKERQQQQALAATTKSTSQQPLLQQPKKHVSSHQNDHPPRKRRNRWDNNNDAPVVNNHLAHEHQQRPNLRNVIPPDDDKDYTNTYRDEYGRRRKHERERDDYTSNVRDNDMRYSRDHPRRRWDDDVDTVEYRSHRDEDGSHHNNRRKSRYDDRSSSDRRHHDRHDHDYYNDKEQPKRRRQYK